MKFGEWFAMIGMWLGIVAYLICRIESPATTAGAADNTPPTTTVHSVAKLQATEEDKFFAALHQIEASGRLNPPDGDGGKSIGPLQIQRVYWLDARMPNGDYENCRQLGYAKEVVKRYMQRYVGKDWNNGENWEKCFRIHNGGPRGHLKQSTVIYGKRGIELMK